MAAFESSVVGVRVSVMVVEGGGAAVGFCFTRLRVEAPMVDWVEAPMVDWVSFLRWFSAGCGSGAA
jgi:hypothetical protein